LSPKNCFRTFIFLSLIWSFSCLNKNRKGKDSVPAQDSIVIEVLPDSAEDIGLQDSIPSSMLKSANLLSYIALEKRLKTKKENHSLITEQVLLLLQFQNTNDESAKAYLNLNETDLDSKISKLISNNMYGALERNDYYSYLTYFYCLAQQNIFHNKLVQANNCFNEIIQSSTLDHHHLRGEILMKTIDCKAALDEDFKNWKVLTDYLDSTKIQLEI
jgi:hypothetical protein